MKIYNYLQSFLIIYIFTLLSFPMPAAANNLTIENVTIEDRNPNSKTAVVEFDASWENSWRTKINHDALWLTFRLYDPSQMSTGKKMCEVTTAGLNPTGTYLGSNNDLEIYVPEDKKGIFIRPANYGAFASINATDLQVTIDYDSCGFLEDDAVRASVFGLEMVFVPEGAFYAGDFDASTAALDEGSADSDPWYISSAGSISVSNPTANGYRYVANGAPGEDATGTSFSIAAAYPKGYSAFYTMKYELTEGQWVEFVNALPSAARNRRDITDSSHKNSDTVRYRNTVSCSGSPLSCSTNRPWRALSYITWMDLAAFLDWNALRPMTELEFEKAARGPLLSVAGEFAWRTTDITAAGNLSGTEEDGSETVTTTGANAHYNNNILSGGDAGNGADYQQGPLRVGIFATSSSTRETAGAGYYGVMELSGNLLERVVTIGNSSGRGFIGSHGDGVLAAVSGYEGNADVADWPGIDAITSRGVTGAAGSGFRGGSWSDELSGVRLRVSDRNNAANASTAALNNAGGRGVRSYDGQ